MNVLDSRSATFADIGLKQYALIGYKQPLLGRGWAVTPTRFRIGKGEVVNSLRWEEACPNLLGQLF